MLAGDIDIMGANWATMKDYVAIGDMKPLCLLAEERHSACPDVPTAKEQGYDIQVVKFFFYAFPGGTDPKMVEAFTPPPCVWPGSGLYRRAGGPERRPHRAGRPGDL
jgi:tripartite-type tricarboxylate transporter receptor subunit TctC